MKKALLEMEDGDTGRVKLSDFYGDRAQAYGNADENGFQFTEKVGYLRDIGALDESDPKTARVVVANYLGLPGNCLATTGFYKVCCVNECDAILGQIERQLAAPSAPPQKVSAIVAEISSATVPAPRALPAPLLDRLEEIARHHGGQVPLHGRLFAQWLHHAFKRECPYPQAAHTTSPVTPDQWMQAKGEVVAEEKAVIAQHTTNRSAPAAGSDNATVVVAVPWTSDEELVCSHECTYVTAAAVVMAALPWAGWELVVWLGALVIALVIKPHHQFPTSPGK